MYAAQDDVRASASQLTVDVSYVCSVCTSAWPYQAVRNTGRCPACGSGLQRSGE
jgi:rRNA maturation endonuclease Nob1